jgi:hypothetical protein
LVHFYSKIWSYACSNKGPATEFRVGPRRDALAPSASALEATPAEATRRPRPRLPHAPTPLGSLESSRAARRRLSAPYQPGARHGPSVRWWPPAVRALVEAARPRPHLRGHAVVIASRVPLFKVTFHPRAHHHCQSPRHDCRLSELPFFPSVSSPADTPNTSSSSHVSRSLCLWESRKPPSPATPPTAAAAASPRRAPTPASPPPQLRPPPDPR